MLPNEFQSLCNWLFERMPQSWSPQIAFGGEGKVARRWIPGAKPLAPDAPPLSQVAAGAKYLGVTNRAYHNYEQLMSEQFGFVCWLGWDIDSKHNPGVDLYSLVERVDRATGGLVSVRTSCSGKGLHLIQRLARPVALPLGSPSRYYTAVCKILGMSVSRRLREQGVMVDKDDSRVFWMWGGDNRWLYQTDYLLDTKAPDLSAIEDAMPKAAQKQGTRVPVSDWVRSWLSKLQVEPGPCYIGTLYDRLVALGESPVTCSSMSGNGDLNGYVDVGADWIQVWSYADHGPIWRAEDVDSLLAASDEA